MGRPHRGVHPHHEGPRLLHQNTDPRVRGTNPRRTSHPGGLRLILNSACRPRPEVNPRPLRVQITVRPRPGGRRHSSPGCTDRRPRSLQAGQNTAEPLLGPIPGAVGTRVCAPRALTPTPGHGINPRPRGLPARLPLRGVATPGPGVVTSPRGPQVPRPQARGEATAHPDPRDPLLRPAIRTMTTNTTR